jgi:hypothetical protein
MWSVDYGKKRTSTLLSESQATGYRVSLNLPVLDNNLKTLAFLACCCQMFAVNIPLLFLIEKEYVHVLFKIPLAKIFERFGIN